MGSRRVPKALPPVAARKSTAADGLTHQDQQTAPTYTPAFRPAAGRHMTTALPALPRSDDFLGHPKGVYVCFFTEMWERFSFYGMKALLLLYLTKHHLVRRPRRPGPARRLRRLGLLHAGHRRHACRPLAGACARRWSSAACCWCSATSAWPSKATPPPTSAAGSQRDQGALSITCLSLALIIAGVGFMKPNISTIVGRLYAEDDPRRDSGFSLFYAGINLGALFASLACGFSARSLWLALRLRRRRHRHAARPGHVPVGQKYLHGHAEPPAPHSAARAHRRRAARMADLPRRPLAVLPIARYSMWAAANGARPRSAARSAWR